MLQIYRVQHKETSLGPFQTPGELTQALATKTLSRSDLKSPGDDGLPLGDIPFCFVFGCPDLAALKKWFLLGETSDENRHIIQTLKKQGFVLAEYLVEASDYMLSNSGMQVAFSAFDCHDEGLVEFHDLDTLLAADAAPCVPVH